jgi:iron complex outermembrane recepter protein
MRNKLRGASGVALFAAVFGASSAWAQEAQPQTPQTPPAPQTVDQAAPEVEPGTQDRVVVTGQLIAGATEDAPLPVETFALEDLQEQGAPTAMEFLRTINISSEASGNSDGSIAGAAAGFANVNLRGLGTGRTMVLLNGKRFQAGDGGFGADINTIPNFAVGRVDVLKDGASVTYGAGAVGGVINYITRKLDGLEVQGNWKTYDKSAGEGEISALWGKQGDAADILIGASYGWQHELHLAERDYANLPYTSLPGAYQLSDANPATYTLFNQNGSPTAVAAIRDFTQAQCQAAGGELVRVLNTASTSNECAIRYTPSYNFLEHETYTRGYLETNFDLTDTQSIHFELNYAKTDNPYVRTPPTLGNGGTRATEARPAGNTLGTYNIPYQIPVYNALGTTVTSTVTNPYANEFYNRAFANGLITSTVNSSRGDLSPSGQWRPVMAGGNSGYEDGKRYEWTQRETFGGVLSLKGEFTEDGFLGRFLPENTTYELSGTYRLYSFLQSRPTILKSRLENALRGYGGPECKAIDRVATVTVPLPERSQFATQALYEQAVFTARQNYDRSVGIQSDTAPGTNGCQFFNPFISSYQTNLFTGAPNTAYAGAGFQNSPELMRWMQTDRVNDQRSEALTIDGILTGEVPGFELPGGKIGWAAGVQWRQTEFRLVPVMTAEEFSLESQRCTWGDVGLPATFVGQDQCVANSGPNYDAGLGRLIPTFTDRQWISYYGELQIPVLDNLNFQVAVRREDYSTLVGDIWKVAGKYDVFDWLSFRGSYSTNFQVPPDSINNTEPQVGATYIASLLRSVPTTVITVPGITPEDDTGANIGVIFAPEVFDGQLRASADFWEFKVLGEIGNTSLTASLFPNVFGTAAPAPGAVANCSAPFIGFFRFEGGACVQGTSTAAAINNVDLYQLNTGGYITNGIDYQADYTHDLGPGELTVAASFTNVLVYKVKGYDLTPPGGTSVRILNSFNGLGSTNFSRTGTVQPEWRGNASIRYALDEHVFNLRMNYIQGVQDDSALVKVGAGPDGVVNATCTNLTNCLTANTGGTASDDRFATYGWFPNDYTDFDFTYIWTPSFVEDFQLRVSVLNVTDEDPMPAQNANSGGIGAGSSNRSGYLNGFGNPRGRQFSIGLTKKF